MSILVIYEVDEEEPVEVVQEAPVEETAQEEEAPKTRGRRSRKTKEEEQ